MKATVSSEDVVLQIGEVSLSGALTLPEGATGVVAFAHGSGSSRFSPRNRYVAAVLNDARLGTLLFDLLTSPENDADQQTAALRFNIELLTERLAGAVDWLARSPGTRNLKIGLFGASTGAAAALVTAANRPAIVAAVVSRGGRPDLAGDALPRVVAPTLLIVGGQDSAVLDLNRLAAQQLRCDHRVETIPGATHLFEERGALEHAARLARDWFADYL
ncbi:MAG: dienelactone hydrolase family protein [Phycisphaerae bacterium]|nr:dienelactone hydrolase family protein [Phycisphaerae bacterium]